MAGSKEAAVKMMETIRRKYGVTSDGKSKLHVEAGTIGGRISRRPKKEEAWKKS